MAMAPIAPFSGTDREIWNRLPGESEEAFGAWVLYRDMEPPRSLRRVGEELGKSETLMERWSSRWRWVRRLEAYLQDREQRRLIELEKTIRQTKERHIGIAKMLQAKALERLQTIDTSHLSPNAVVRFLDLAVEIERKSLDLDNGPIKQVTETNTTAFSLSETRDLRSDLQERIQQLSPVSRDLIRQLSIKHLQLLKLHAEIHSDHGDAIPSLSAAAPDRSAEDQPAGDGGSEPPAGQHSVTE
jgi:hypothetical protein